MEVNLAGNTFDMLGNVPIAIIEREVIHRTVLGNDPSESIASEEYEDTDNTTISGGRSSSCSDVVDEEELKVGTTDKNRWIVGTSASTLDQINGTVLPNPDPTNFENVEINDSSYLHLGNRTYYKGPVTIQQFLHCTSSLENGIDAQGKYEKNAVGGKNISESKYNIKSPTESSFLRIKEWIKTRRRVAIACGSLVFLIPVIILSVWFGNIYYHREVSNSTESSPFLTSAEPMTTSLSTSSTLKIETTTETDVFGVQFVPRSEWGATLPKERQLMSKLPPQFVIISHTVTRFCETKSRCIDNVRSIQRDHMESRNFSDIAYNFLLGGDGSVFVGRDWDVVGAHSGVCNRNSLGIAFIGNYMYDNPTEAQIDTCKKLLELSVKINKLSRSYKLLGHRQVSGSEGPGDKLFEIIKTFDHWSPNE